jgi:hypothetical protein
MVPAILRGLRLEQRGMGCWIPEQERYQCIYEFVDICFVMPVLCVYSSEKVHV